MMELDDTTVCGYVAIVGRPNVGKSTLLNHILGEKLSITSRKPQTTRDRVLGVKTMGSIQTVYVDTPGMHIKEIRAMNRYMNRVAKRALHDVDVVVFVVEGLKWTEEDQFVLDKIQAVQCPVILVINKVDVLAEKNQLLPHLKWLSLRFNFFDILPISARRKTNIVALEQVINKCLPKGPHYFPETQTTDRTPRFRIAELIREQVLRGLGAELPYTTAVEIEKLDSETIVKISAIIWVERNAQKPIVIGKEGERLKEIGTRARIGIEKMLGKKVHLRLWVRVREGWSNDERAMKSLGYFDLEED